MLTIDLEEPVLFLDVLCNIDLVYFVVEIQLFHQYVDLLAIRRAGGVTVGIR